MNHRRSMFAAGWLTVVAVASVVAGWGMLKGGLPHPSLDFRWQYWTASAAMFGDHPWTGVGAENFGNHYTAYKPITSPEEVKNPHNSVGAIRDRVRRARIGGGCGAAADRIVDGAAPLRQLTRPGISLGFPPARPAGCGARR
jgi:hypothetical protein